jgi:hypothetical protein
MLCLLFTTTLLLHATLLLYAVQLMTPVLQHTANLFMLITVCFAQHYYDGTAGISSTALDGTSRLCMHGTAVCRHCH